MIITLYYKIKLINNIIFVILDKYKNCPKHLGYLMLIWLWMGCKYVNFEKKFHLPLQSQVFKMV